MDSQGEFQFGCLLETRVREGKAQKILSSVFKDWSSITNYEHGRLGRIWVLWGPNVRVTPCCKSGQFITCSIMLEGMAEEVLCTFVYARNTSEERRELWEDLKNHHDSPMFRNKPWLVMGDFNEIIEVEENSGQDYVISQGMREFGDTLTHCSLVDSSYQGPKLTWCNKRDAALICKKLDRTLINVE